ncbi:TonB-dependent receptor [Sphingomonas panacis]|uniref:TonB-dependent receptor n=1 Tax=Sphingomonas panacis TaxID=1560345 RepID=A0A1B3ZAP3_9SPHN|nr:TonB-dependent receptor [Sphingomonas panacis]AOH84504.1 TonB-dependent receptor [Sphingomonas panacis]
MTQSSSRAARQHAFLALSCVGALIAPAALAQTADDTSRKDAPALGGVTVTDTVITQAPGRRQDSPKATRPLRDTPQTVTILTKEVLEQQNLLSLKDALSTVPGITFGAGEGGGGYGDSITLRGYSANNDITIDNVRDSAQYSRTDTFNVEQIEVTNGANSVSNGSGSVGGNINLVTKRPLDHDTSIVTAGVGTDNYYRATADISQHVTDTIAVRLNAMYHRNDIPGRDVEKNRRWGVAPSITFGMGTSTRLTFEYMHQEDTNIPQFGVPYISGAIVGSTTGASYSGPIPGVDRSDYYGFRNLDTQRINFDQATQIFEHDFSDKVSIRNLTRYQDVTQFTRADGPEGNFCLPSGRTVLGAVCSAPGLFTPSGGSRGNTRSTENQLAYTQTDLKAVANTGFIEHTLDVGFSLSRENYNAATGNSQRAANGAAATITPYAIFNPDANNVYTGPVNFVVASRPKSQVDNYAVYLFDAAKLSDHFEINGGVRWERNIAKSQTNSYSTTVGSTFGTLTTAGPTLYNRDSLFSYRIGLVYKPIEAASLYVAYGNSKTPSQSTVNGSCTFTPTATVPSSTCSTRPEGAKNYEIGGKVELFDGGLLLTAALFRNERDSYRVPSGDPTVPDQQTDGRSRVNGLALGASGHITPAWSITANYTHLNSKLLQSVSDKCLAAPGSGNCTNTVAAPNPGGGSELLATPKDSGSIYTAYTLPFGLTLGYGATYQGPFALNTPTTTSALVYHSHGYIVHNATISYDITKALSAQVNVKNIGDKLYYTRIRANNGWATPGDARSALLTISYKL